jgi:phosphoribosylpyrophosphate synthetase
MHFFAGSSHPALAQALAQELGTPLGKVTLKQFS